MAHALKNINIVLLAVMAAYQYVLMNKRSYKSYFGVKMLLTNALVT